MYVFTVHVYILFSPTQGPLPPPSCKTPSTQPASLPVPSPSSQRSQNGNKEKSGLLLKAHFLTKKGKKLIGKWKPTFLVLDPAEGELQFYEKESNHRAKGLLDLVHCQVFPVHRSLTGMTDSFSILSKYGREEQMYYLGCENPETARVSVYHQFLSLFPLSLLPSLSPPPPSLPHHPPPSPHRNGSRHWQSPPTGSPNIMVRSHTFPIVKSTASHSQCGRSRWPSRQLIITSF